MASTVHTRLRELTAPASDDPIMPVDFSRRRWAISRPAAVVLCAAAVVIVAIAGVAAKGVAGPETAVVSTGTVAPVHPESGAAESIPAAAEGQPQSQLESGSIVVSVVGLVHRPGVVTLPAGARVNDAIEAVGGFLTKANPASVNLARPLADGEQIEVSDKANPAANSGASGAPGSAAAAGSGAAPSSGAVGGAAGSPKSAGAGKVNVNSASATELETLPGIGPATAAAIIAFREDNGPFTSVAQLGEVSGIGPKKLEKINDLVTV